MQGKKAALQIAVPPSLPPFDRPFICDLELDREGLLRGGALPTAAMQFQGQTWRDGGGSGALE